MSFVAGLLLTNISLLAGLDPYGLSIAVLAVSGLVLLLGHYRALDRLSKLLVVLLTLLTGVAAASLLIRGPVGDVAASWVSTGKPQANRFWQSSRFEWPGWADAISGLLMAL